MDGRLQRRVQRYGWDRASAHYEKFWSEQLRPAQRRSLELAAVRPGERVLDVACGTGLVTFPAAEAAGATGFVFDDPSAEQLADTLDHAVRLMSVAEVKRRIVRSGMTRNLDWAYSARRYLKLYRDLLGHGSTEH